MTLRFTVGRILRELIELAERDEDAELVDALHDALDVAVAGRRAPALKSSGGIDRGVNETSRSRSGLYAGWEEFRPEPTGRWGAGRDCPLGRMMVDDGGGFPPGDNCRGRYGAASAGAVRGGVPGAARRRGRTHGRRRRCRLTAPEPGGGDGRAVRGRGGGRPLQWAWSVFPSLGLALRTAMRRAPGGGRWRVYGTRGCRCRRRPGRGKCWAAGWRRGSRTHRQD